MKKILIVNANYYRDISLNLVRGAKKILNGFKVSLINVPGVFEIPISIKKNIKEYDGFVALGCVIKGKTPHFDLLCQTSFDAIMKISINSNKPVGNGIITALNKSQAITRSSLKKGSLKTNKGSEAAKAVVSVLENDPKKI